MLKEGTKAPNFTLEGDDGSVHKLENYLGKPLIIFFYPKDSTPGCTTEACDFSEKLSGFKNHNANILGISKDSLASHARFKSKHDLRFPLLSDPDLSVHKKYGAFKEGSLFGKSAFSINRSTFLIDGSGIIRKVWYKVRVKGHADIVFEELRKMISE